MGYGASPTEFPLPTVPDFLVAQNTHRGLRVRHQANGLLGAM